jgi:hypothetical protein
MITRRQRTIQVRTLNFVSNCDKNPEKVQPIWQVQSDSKGASQLKLDQPLKQHYRFWMILVGSKYRVDHH